MDDIFREKWKIIITQLRMCFFFLLRFVRPIFHPHAGIKERCVFYMLRWQKEEGRSKQPNTHCPKTMGFIFSLSLSVYIYMMYVRCLQIVTAPKLLRCFNAFRVFFSFKNTHTHTHICQIHLYECLYFIIIPSSSFRKRLIQIILLLLLVHVQGTRNCCSHLKREEKMWIKSREHINCILRLQLQLQSKKMLWTALVVTWRIVIMLMVLNVVRELIFSFSLPRSLSTFNISQSGHLWRTPNVCICSAKRMLFSELQFKGARLVDFCWRVIESKSAISRHIFHYSY